MRKFLATLAALALFAFLATIGIVIALAFLAIVAGFWIYLKVTGKKLFSYEYHEFTETRAPINDGETIEVEYEVIEEKDETKN